MSASIAQVHELDAVARASPVEHRAELVERAHADAGHVEDDVARAHPGARGGAVGKHAREPHAVAAARVIERLGGGGPRPVYATVARPPRAARGATNPDKAFLGVVVDPRGRDGVRLSSVLPVSAAARAGMREGDVIVDVAGVGVSSLEELRAVLDRRRPGDGVQLVFLRDGRGHAASATLDARPEDVR